MALGLGFGCCCDEDLATTTCTLCDDNLIYRYWRVDVAGIATGLGGTYPGPGNTVPVDGCTECSQLNGSYLIEIGVHAPLPRISGALTGGYGFGTPCSGSLALNGICGDHEFTGLGDPYYDRIAFGVMNRADDSPLVRFGVAFYSTTGSPTTRPSIFWGTTPELPKINCLAPIEFSVLTSDLNIICHVSTAVVTATPISASEFGA